MYENLDKFDYLDDPTFLENDNNTSEEDEEKLDNLLKEYGII